MRAEQSGQECSCDFHPSKSEQGLLLYSEKPGWVYGPGREPTDDVSAQELGRMEK